MKNVVLAGYARSPFHFANKGGLAKVRPDEMAGQVVRALVERTGVAVDDIEDLIMGCALPEGEQGLNIGPYRRRHRRAADHRRRFDRQPVLRLVHAVDPHGRRSDSDERR